MFKELKYPPIAYWEVTDYCNHECIHCFNYWRTDKDFVPCMRKEAENLEMAGKIAEQKPVRVIVTGGEPLTMFHSIRTSIELFLMNNISVSINTNAALVNEEIAAFLKENNISLFISFPSCVEGEFDQIVNRVGAYQKVRRALHMLREYGVRFSINMVVSKVNLNSIYETARFIKEEYGLKHMSITRVSMPINAIAHFDEYMLSKEELEQYMEACVKASKELNMRITAASPFTPCSIPTQEAYDIFANKHTCTAGRTSYVVSSTGKVRACVRDSKEYGNILEDSFEKIWKNMVEWRDDSLIPVECAECSHKRKCQGGCRTDGLAKGKCRNALDHYSDTKNASVKFVNYSPYLPRWDFFTSFRVPENLQSVEENEGIRVSVGGDYMYLTEKLWKYLSEIKEFTVSDFCEHFDVDLNKAIQVLYHLYTRKIIKVKGKDGKENE